MNSDLVIDAEVHLLHPEAREPDFARDRGEPVRKYIHEHPDFPLLENKMGLPGLMSSMAESGIEQALIMGLPWRDQGIRKENNDYVLACAREHPGRFKALYIPDPLRPEQAVREIEALDQEFFAGIKLIPSWQGVAADDEALAPIWRAATAREMWAMVHTDHPFRDAPDQPHRLLNLARNNPALKILAPHLGGLLCLYALLPEVKKLLSRVVFVSSVSATMEFTAFAARVNPNNVIFGADFPFNHCHDQITPLRAFDELGLPPSVAAGILGETARKLLGFPDPEGRR